MHLKTALYLGLGVFAGLALNNTIAGFINPILASVKLSVAVSG